MSQEWIVTSIYSTEPVIFQMRHLHVYVLHWFNVRWWQAQTQCCRLKRNVKKGLSTQFVFR
jgi:hypothetical protein